MSASPLPPQKRPWYLFAALVAGWIYGARALNDGWDTVSYYRDERVDVRTQTEAINNSAAREAVIAVGERWLELRDAAKSRELPLAVASLLLGSAMILFSARSMAAREGARSALIQVVIVHAALVVAGGYLVANVERARTEYQLRALEAMRPEPMPPGSEGVTGAFARATPLVEIFIQSIASGLIVLALTRPRARAFFRASPEQLEG